MLVTVTGAFRELVEWGGQQARLPEQRLHTGSQDDPGDLEPR
ncbi:hypothetical protein BH20CHL3_BH20CHL3_00080 [soil metagenome]